MADPTRNIFTLSEYSDSTIAGEGVQIDTVYVPFYPPNTGYFAGGSSSLSSISKTQFSTDTSSTIPSNLPNVRGAGSAATSDTALYMAVGAPSSPPATTRTDKLTYSTDTVSSLTENIPTPGSQGIYSTNKGVFGTKLAGYMAGGVNWPSNSTLNNVWKLPFANETWDNVPTMPGGYTRRIATSSETHGYIGSGYYASGGGNDSRVYKMSYSTDSGSNFSTINQFNSATGGSGTSSPTAGYVVGGNYNYTFQLPFSTDSVSRLPASDYPLSEVSNQGAAGNTTHGYHGGGGGGPAGNRSSIYKFDYSTGGWSGISGTTGVVRNNPFGGGGMTMPDSIGGVDKRWRDNADVTPNNSYFGGGMNPMVSLVDRLDMTTDTVANVSGMDLYNPSYSSGNMASSPTRGYYMGTYPGSRSNVWMLLYSTDSRAQEPSMNMSVPMSYTTSTGNATKGYIMGGETGSPSPQYTVSMVHRMTYSTDTTARVPGANLTSVPNEYGSGASTSAVSSSGDESGSAYLAGGQQWPSQGYRSNIWKMSYSSETTSVIPQTIPNTDASMSGHSEKSAGYFAGGRGQSSPYNHDSVYKIPWATDTLSEDGGSGHTRLAGAGGNLTALYQGGGIHPGPGSAVSHIRKYTYATSTSENAGNLTTGGGPDNLAPRQYLFGTGPRTSNLPSVPNPPAVTLTPSLSAQDQNWGLYHRLNGTNYVKRDFSTDSVSNLTNNYATAWSSNAVADANAIWTSDWANPGWSHKVDWSTQTNTVTPNTWPGTPSNSWVGQHSAANWNDTKGWFTGGQMPSFPSPGGQGVGNRRQSLTFATGTGSNDQSQNYIWKSVGTSSAARGYMYGGQNQENQALDTISYMDFASASSWNTVPGNPDWVLSYRRSEAAATGNKDKAYIAGTVYPIPNQPNPVSRFEKFTYATETKDLLPSVVLTNNSNRGLSATGNQTHGYWAGGDSNVSNKLVYATETVSSVPNYSPKERGSWAISQSEDAHPAQINVPIEFQ